MAAMASSLTPTAFSVTKVQLHRENDAGMCVVPCGVQLRRDSGFRVALRGRGAGLRERKAVRGFSRTDGEDLVDRLPVGQDVPNISVRSHSVVMKKGYGAFGGGGATLSC